MADLATLVEVIKYQLEYNRKSVGMMPAKKYDVDDIVRSISPSDVSSVAVPAEEGPLESPPPVPSFSEIVRGDEEIGFKINDVDFLKTEIREKIKKSLSSIESLKGIVGKLKTNKDGTKDIKMMKIGNLVDDFNLYADFDRYSATLKNNNVNSLNFYVSNYDFVPDDKLIIGGGADTKRLNALKADQMVNSFGIFGLPKSANE